MADMVPQKSDPLWNALLSGQSDPAFSSLATKLLVTRLRQIVRNDPNSISAAVDEIFQYFTTNPFAQCDLSKL
jgi:hypothetical protein